VIVCFAIVLQILVAHLSSHGWLFDVFFLISLGGGLLGKKGFLAIATELGYRCDNDWGGSFASLESCQQ
jgi:hypothetical protein